MFRILCLLLIFTSSVAFTQAQKKPETYKFFEFEKISDSLLKEKFEGFYRKIKTENSLQGCIVNYGTNKEIAKREKQIRDLINFRDDDAPRLRLCEAEKKNNRKQCFGSFRQAQNCQSRKMIVA